jgi:hypothetical protein
MRNFSILIFLLFLFSNLFSQPLSFEEAKSKLLKAKAEDYPESNVLNVSNKYVRLDSLCHYVKISENFSKVLRDGGKREVANKTFFYDSNYDTLWIVKLELIKSNGKAIKLNADSIFKRSSSTAVESFSNIYTETGWILSGTVPGVEVGDILHVVTKDSVYKSRMENNFFDRVDVEGFSAYLNKYYELIAPKDLKINLVEINKKDSLAKISIKDTGQNKIYTVDVDYVKPIIYEPGMDDADFFAYYIMFTTVDSWQDISKWYYNLVDKHLKVDDAIKSKVKELIKDAKTDSEKVANIFYWVAQKIRYLGVDKEKNRPGYEPHDVTYTFATRGGVCRDKAALLVAMLREAGIKSDPIIISVGYQLNKAAPVMWFNHAVAVAYGRDGKPKYFLDPTNETTKDFFPQYEEDNTYIIAREEGADLAIVPVSPPEKNNTSIFIVTHINDDLSADLSITIKYRGLADTYLRGSFMRKNDKERKLFIKQVVKNINPTAVIKSVSYSDPQDKTKNLEIKADFHVPVYVSQDNKYSFIPYNASKLDLAYMYDYIVDVFSLSDRKYPFKIDNTFSIDVQEIIHSPFSMKKVVLPELKPLDISGFKFKTSQELSKNSKVLISNVSFSASKIHFKVDEYKALKKEISHISNYDNLFVIGKDFVK